MEIDPKVYKKLARAPRDAEGHCLLAIGLLEVASALRRQPPRDASGQGVLRAVREGLDYELIGPPSGYSYICTPR